jgi:glycosyltransferase 2 family protein
VKKFVRWILLILGLALFGWFIHRAGPAEVWANVRQLGWCAPIVLLPFLLVYFCDTWGWYLAFGSYAAVRPSYWTLFRVRWAGEAVNNVIPSGYVGGEALKAYLLHKRGVPGLTAGTSVVASKTCQVLAQGFFIGLGAFAGHLNLPADSGARRGMMLIALLSLVAILLIFALQRRGMFNSLHAVLSRLGIHIKAIERHEAHLRQLDRQIFTFYHRDPKAFASSTLVYLLGWLADSLEIYVVCLLLGLNLSWTAAVAIESFISVAKALGIFAPAAMGVQESGVLLLFHLFGLSTPAGVAYALIRRGRDLFYVLVGGALLYAEEASFRRVLIHAAEDRAQSGAEKKVPALPG